MTDNPQQSHALALKDAFMTRIPSFQAVLPTHLSAERLVRVALACVARTPKLQQCSTVSLLNACMQAAELGLEPGSALGEAYLVPYGQTAQLIPGYRGLIALGRRSGQIQDVEAHVVHRNDKFFVRFGTTPHLEHEPELFDPGPTVAVYCSGRIKGSDFLHVEVMTIAEVEAVKRRSRSAGNGPWVTDYDEMARKTVVRRMMKYMPMSVEMSKAIELDDRDYVDATAEPPKRPSSLRERAYAVANEPHPESDATTADEPDDEGTP